jgi:hypothetical protein
MKPAGHNITPARYIRNLAVAKRQPVMRGDLRADAKGEKCNEGQAHE